jgi:thiol-disulfide isomerase/thioredoxin
MAKVYNQVKPKVPKEVIYGFVAVLVVIIGLFLFTLESNASKIYSAYEPTTATLTEDHPFYEVTYRGGLFSEGIKDKIANDETFLLYIGSPLCPACVQTIGQVESFFRDNNVGVDAYLDQIYYYQDFLGGNATADRNDFLADFPSITRKTPQFILFIDGEVVLEYIAPAEGGNVATNVRNFFVDARTLLRP